LDDKAAHALVGLIADEPLHGEDNLLPRASASAVAIAMTIDAAT
jgi:hypothetical protein